MRDLAAMHGAYAPHPPAYPAARSSQGRGVLSAVDAVFPPPVVEGSPTRCMPLQGSADVVQDAATGQADSSAS
eukprot:2613334-Pleurochrysis_carterae.AAC.1